MNATNETQVYLVLSLKEVRNLYRIAKAKAKACDMHDKTCVILCTQHAPGHSWGSRQQLSSADVRVEGCSLWSGKPA